MAEGDLDTQYTESLTDNNISPDPDQEPADEFEAKDEEELLQLEKEVGKNVAQDGGAGENGTDKAQQEKIERLKLIRKRRKEAKQAKKLAEKPEEPHLKQLLAALETSFDGKEFETLMKVVQPKENELRARFYHIRNDLRDALLRYYPAVDIKVFGSCVTDMAFNGSDFDFYINVPGNEDFQSKLSRVHRLICNSKEFFRPIKIPKARTPLVKFMHFDTKIKCDANVSNPLGVFNSEFLRWALQFDPRIKPLAVCIKYWSRVHFLGGINQMTSYTITLMIILYLQMKKEPVFPPIYLLQENVPPYWVNMWNMAFDDRFPNTTRNRETIPELLEGFFQFYASVVFEEVILCPYTGKIYPRSIVTSVSAPEFDSYRHSVQSGRQPMNLETSLCLQDPFEQNVNCASPTAGHVVKRFKDYCALAVKLCAEFPSDTFRTSILLKKLFTESPPPSAPQSLLELAAGTAGNDPNRKICKVLPMTYELQIMNRYCQKHNLGTAKRVVLKQWGEQAFNFVLKFFTAILQTKFYPFEIKRFQRGRFVLADFQLRIRADTWTGREKIEFKNEDELQREIKLSEELKEKNPPVNLDIELTVLSTKDREFIEIELVSVTKKDLDQLQAFFEATVQQHIRSVLKGYFTMLIEQEGLENIDVKDNVAADKGKSDEDVSKAKKEKIDGNGKIQAGAAEATDDSAYDPFTANNDEDAE